MDLVERLREWRDDRREVDQVTMAGQHPNTELLGEAADRIEALEEALEAIKELCDTEDDTLLIWQTARDALAVEAVE